MAGKQATRELLRLVVETPIIAMTANAMKEARYECLNAGMVDYITKPFKQRDLWDCLLRYLTPVTAEAIDSKPPVASAESSSVKEVGTSGIDRATGIFFLGDEDFYDKMLARFVREQPGEMLKLEQAIDNVDHRIAFNTAHQMKAFCATVGASRLSELLEEIELIFMTGSSDGYSEAMLDECKSELQTVLKEIHEMNLPEESQAASALDIEKALKLIGEIKPLLENHIPLNADQIEAVRHALAPAGEPFERLIEQIYGFDLEEALETLCEIEVLIK